MIHGKKIKFTSLIVIIILLATSIAILSPSVRGDSSIVITAPDASSIWYTGGSYNILWDGSEITDEYVAIYYYLDPNFYYDEGYIITSNTANDGVYSWAVPTALNSNNYYIKISSTNNPDTYTTSDLFQIVKSTISVTSFPSAGLTCGHTYDITWTSTGYTGTDVMIELGSGLPTWPDYRSVLVIASSTTNDGSYSWTLPTTINLGNLYIYDLCIKVTSKSDSTIYGYDHVSINNLPIITITSPINGDVWTSGQAYKINWTMEYSTYSNVMIQYDYQGGSSPITINPSINMNNQQYTWTIPLSIAPKSNYYIIITSLDDSLVVAKSAPFQIINPVNNAICITSPTSASVWTANQTYDITWSNTGTTGSNVKIEYYNSTSSSPITIVSSTSNDGTYSWVIPTAISTGSDYIVRIISISDSSIFGQSAYFTIENIPVSIEYSELHVTLHSDGTEHDYIKTTDSALWTSSETFWASGDAYNKVQTTSGIYTIIEYDLDDIALYKKGSQTGLSSNGEGDSRVWIYSDHFMDTVDLYVLTLPSGCEYISSNPTYANKNSNEIIWNDIDGQDTQFKSSTFNDMVDTSSNDSTTSSSNLMLYIGIGIGLILLIVIIILVVVIKNKKNGGR
ncbi:MAG: Ser-Thr-rich GPI-anchored membrane family protein [Methanomassiliicoccales archaeon]